MDEEKKMGLLKSKKLDRKAGNFEPVTAYEEKTETRVSPPKIRKEEKNLLQNQSASLKIPQTTKNELFALRTLTRTKFDYEMIQTLIDYYVGQLDTADYKKFKLLLEIQD